MTDTRHPRSRTESTSHHQADSLTGSVGTGVEDVSPPHEPPKASTTILGHRMHTSRSVLALAFGKECIFAGLQGGHIMVFSPQVIRFQLLLWRSSKCSPESQAWSFETYAPVLLVHAHEESVLGLYASDDKALLFSCGGDSVVNVR